MPEILNLPLAMKYSGIPLSHQERLSRPDIPFILYGGAAASVANIVHGPIGEEDGGGNSLIDGAFFGYGEDIIDHVYKFIMERNQEYKIKENKMRLVHELLDLTKNFYYPLAYEFVYNEKYPLRIDAIRKSPGFEHVPDKVEHGLSYNTNFVGFNRKIFNIDGENATSHDIMISMGCSGEGACTFCNEGIIGGPFREKSLEGIRKDMNEVKYWSAANSVGFYSYNLNYYSKLFDLLGEAGRNFGQLSLINMRTDEISVNPDFLRLAKALGQIRISMAVEGLGERMRNVFLNKNLTREQLMKGVRNVFQQRFILLKMG